MTPLQRSAGLPAALRFATAKPLSHEGAVSAGPAGRTPEPDDTLQERGVLAFGPFKLDPLRRTLLCDGIPVALTARLFETLFYLARNPERVVARDELEHAVWHGRAVEEGNLQKAISSLRKVLQADATGKTYIVTIAGRGFQFTAPVAFEPAEAAPAGPASYPAVSEPPARLHGSRIRSGIVVVFIVVVVAALILNFRSSDYRDAAPPGQSVGVLPFLNMSGDTREDYFSDGLTDELINTLSRVDGLQVAARTSAFTFKGSTATIGEIGRRLGVAAVLEGSVSRDGQRVHIAVQLINTLTGFQFWSRSYDRDRVSDDILGVQTEIAQSVASTLKIKLMQADAGRLAAGGTNDGAAFDAYLRGTTNDREFGQANIRQAILDFTKAIELDPNYAQAYAARAAAHNYLIVDGYNADATDDAREAAAAAAHADTAIRLAPALAEAHRVKSLVLFRSLAFDGAAAELAIAVELAPNDALVEATCGTIEARLGHSETAIAAARRAIALDPLNPNAYQRLGEAFYWTRHFDEALEAFGHATAADQHPSRINLAWRASATLANGNPAAAEQICAGGNGWTDDACLAMADHALGNQAEAERRFARLYKALGDREAYVYAEILAQWGRPVDAARWLETAYSLRDNGLSEMKVSPLLDPIRQTSEYKDIERRLNFPP